MIGRLKEGDQFGDMALLRSAIRTASVKCTDFCDIFVLGSRELQVRLRAAVGCWLAAAAAAATAAASLTGSPRSNCRTS